MHALYARYATHTLGHPTTVHLFLHKVSQPLSDTTVQVFQVFHSFIKHTPTSLRVFCAPREEMGSNEKSTTHWSANVNSWERRAEGCLEHTPTGVQVFTLARE